MDMKQIACLLLSSCVLLCASFTGLYAQQNSADRWEKPALLIVDMQNDFVRTGAPMEVPDARATIPQLQQLIRFCRGADIPVIYTRFLAGTAPRLLWNWSPKLAPPLKACNRGYKRYYADVRDSLECTDIVQELQPAKGDLIIDKFGYGAFHETKLDSCLRAAGIRSLIVVGTVTQICVEETAREAFHHGYKTTLVADGVSSYMPDLHAATIKNFAMKFGWVNNTDDILKQLASRLNSK